MALTYHDCQHDVWSTVNSRSGGLRTFQILGQRRVFYNELHQRIAEPHGWLAVVQVECTCAPALGAWKARVTSWDGVEIGEGQVRTRNRRE